MEAEVAMTAAMHVKEEAAEAHHERAQDHLEKVTKSFRPGARAGTNMF